MRTKKRRPILVLEPQLRKLLSVFAKQLSKKERELATNAGTEHVAHAYIKGRSPVTMAMAHVRGKLTVSCDLVGWFDSITMDHLVAARLPRDVAYQCLHAGVGGGPRVIRQGPPTSPAASNIAAIPMDAMIVRRLKLWSKRNGYRFVYTRYADDMVVSVNRDTPEARKEIRKILSECAARMGWNTHKWREQSEYKGRNRVICGISVSSTGDLTAKRRTLRKLRTLLHVSKHVNSKRLMSKIVSIDKWCSAVDRSDYKQHQERNHGAPPEVKPPEPISCLPIDEWFLIRRYHSGLGLWAMLGKRWRQDAAHRHFALYASQPQFATFSQWDMRFYRRHGGLRNIVEREIINHRLRGIGTLETRAAGWSSIVLNNGKKITIHGKVTKDKVETAIAAGILESLK